LLKSCIQCPVSSESDATVSKLIELIEVSQLDFELQSGAATLAPRQRNEDTGGEPALLRRLQLAADKIQCLLPVDGQHVIGKPRYIHDSGLSCRGLIQTPGDRFALYPPQEWPAIRDPVAPAIFL
jgi:hypothetical protein